MWDVTDTEVKTLCTLTISTHTSRVRCDDDSFKVATSDDAFLLTHPVWDVTYLTLYSLHYHLFLLTHPVWDVTAIYSIFQSHYSHILQDGPIIHLELY